MIMEQTKQLRKNKARHRISSETFSDSDVETVTGMNGNLNFISQLALQYYQADKGNRITSYSVIQSS